MKTFDRYLLSQLTLLFGFFSLVLVSVYWVNRAALLFEELIGDGQSASVFLEFTALALPNVIRLVLPISAFTATIFVINRMSSESELVVARSMGFSPFRMMRAVVVFGLMVTVLISILNHILVPISRSELADRRQAIANNDAAKLLREGRFIHPGNGITFFVGEITDQGQLNGVYLLDASNEARQITYIANQALLVPSEEGLKLIMFEGTSQTLRTSDQRLTTTRFKDAVYDLQGLADTGRRNVRIEELSTQELITPTPWQVHHMNSSRAEFLYEGHARIAQPFLALAGAMIGFAALMLGQYSRFGFGRQIAFAIFLLIVLQLIDNAASDLARQSDKSWPVVYLSPIIGVLMAIGLLFISQGTKRSHNATETEVES
uniref:LPS export ABC transporter permease LptF n=1 Tax=Actibacterium pelagium TaxID=2029103 RepID=UPI000BAAC238|nr:LPS export ABC transporter permease LptF [Actibacterium pelagium]